MNDYLVKSAPTHIRQLETDVGVSGVKPYMIELTNEAGHIRRLEELESEIIRLAVTRYGGHLSETARRLGLGRSTLYRKLKEYRQDTILPSSAEG